MRDCLSCICSQQFSHCFTVVMYRILSCDEGFMKAVMVCKTVAANYMVDLRVSPSRALYAIKKKSQHLLLPLSSVRCTVNNGIQLV